MATIKVINPYDDIEYIDLEPEDSGEDLTRVRSLQVGYGSRVLRIDREGFWLGAERFADAPFSVDMDGNMVATSLDLSGYLQVGDALSDIQSDIFDLSDIDTDLGVITAGTLIGLEIRGGIIKTSSSGARVVIDGDTDAMYIYDASVKRMQLDNDEISFYNSAGAKLGGINTPTTTNMQIQATSGNYLVLSVANSAYYITMDVAGSTVAYFTSTGLNMNSNDIIGIDDIVMSSTTSILNMNSGDIENIDEMYFIANTGNPSTAGQFHYYNSGGVQEYQGKAGTFVGSFDMTAT